jgi:activating signal cointegrator 1
MKVISLLQPWASLVVLGHKKIETRSWNTKYRGELLIHASASKKMAKFFIDVEPFQGVFEKHFDWLIPNIDELPFGAIIGKVNLIDTFHTEDAETIINHSEDLFEIINTKDNKAFEKAVTKEIAFGDYSPNRYGWLLSNPIVFDNPIPAKGMLGLWEFDKMDTF